MPPDRVCVIGLGTIGLPTASYISKKDLQVYGYDLSPNAVRKAKGFFASADWNAMPDAEIYVVCVSTNWNSSGPDVSPVLDVCERISKRPNGKSSLVCVESTVPVGTCRGISEKFGLDHMVHVPHRFWSGDPRRHGIRQTRVMGALNNETMRLASRFYGRLDIPIVKLTSPEAAELTKIVENAHRFVQIAFAEELALICANLGLPFSEIRKGANSKWNVEILEAREGIGGHCLPKDVRYLLSAAKDGAPILEGAIRSDEAYTDARTVKVKIRTPHAKKN